MHYHSHPCFIAHLVLVPSSGSSKEQLQIVSHRESRMTRTLDFSVFPFMSASSNFHPPPPPFFYQQSTGKQMLKLEYTTFLVFFPPFGSWGMHPNLCTPHAYAFLCEGPLGIMRVMFLPQKRKPDFFFSAYRMLWIYQAFLLDVMRQSAFIPHI